MRSVRNWKDKDILAASVLLIAVAFIVNVPLLQVALAFTAGASFKNWLGKQNEKETGRVEFHDPMRSDVHGRDSEEDLTK